jgi:multidrug efflux pump subunit AcrB
MLVWVRSLCCQNRSSYLLIGRLYKALDLGLKIDLQRVSLGALVLAMGMMVDSAILVVDGFLVRLKQGMDRTRAAIESARVPAWPLLGATVVALVGFSPSMCRRRMPASLAGACFRWWPSRCS